MRTVPEIKVPRPVIVALLVAVACGRDAPEPPLLAGPAPRHVAAVITLPSIEQARRDVGAMLEGAGTNTGILDRPIPAWVGVRSLAGVDRSAPAHFVVLQSAGAEPATVLVIRVADRGKLQAARGHKIRVHGGWAAIGERAAVEIVAPWALHELIARPPPAKITVEVTPPVLVRAYPTLRVPAALLGSLDDAADDEAVGRALMGWGLAEAFSSASSITITAEPSRHMFSAEAVATPDPGSWLATVAKAQRPASFALLSRLSTERAAFVVAGQLTLGPLRAQALEAIAGWASDGADDTGDAGDFDRALDGFLEATTGELAVASADGETMTAVYGLADPEAARRHVAALYEGTPPDDVVRVGDTSFLRWRADDGDTLHGALGDHDAVVTGPGSEAALADLVERSRSPQSIAALRPDLAAAVADALAHRASLLFVNHEEGGASVAAAGVADGKVTLRWSIAPARLEPLFERFAEDL